MRSRTCLSAVIFCMLGIASTAHVPPVRGHDRPTPEDIEKSRQNGDLQERLEITKQYENHRLDLGLQQRASFKIQRESLRSQGLSPAEINQRLFGGPEPAFPFTANPELNSTGAAKTLTILIDFNDMRAATVLPGMTTDTISTNIYGNGTTVAQSFRPFESVKAYYARASEGKVDIRGNVLGWYNFPNNRSAYQHTSSNQTARNQAIFNMISEAMGSFDASHDYSQYDHDNDGDIDQVTILYTGPNTGWGSFWWAYKWQFFVNDAFTRTFDGKRLNQFVFQFVSQRGPGNTDFNPRTLIHEMGHSFGLADYYDYNPNLGPPGGVGGLDMMDANSGNQNAFSRWLLDWIQPEVIGADAPSQKQLVASGSTLTGTKAIAVFPNASNTAAPDRELFIVENRHRVGNDSGGSGTPGQGLLIWHVAARPNAQNSDFTFDNSYTNFKLVRLVRADNANDFAASQGATAATYFLPPRVFTPTSSPSSRRYSGAPTRVAITNLSPAGEVMTASVGILPSTPPNPGPLLSSGRLGDEPRITPRDVQRMLGRLEQAPEMGTNPDALEQLSRSLETATPGTLETLWRNAIPSYANAEAVRPGDGPAMSPGGQETESLLQLILTRWATKDGQAAVSAVLNIPEGKLRSQAFQKVMEAWANSNPYAASQWYFGQERADLRNSQELNAGTRFADRIFRWAALNDINVAVGHLNSLQHTSEVWGAVNALESVAERTHLSKEILREKLNGVEKHKGTIHTLQKFRDAADTLRQDVGDPKSHEELLRLMRESLGTHEGEQ